MDICMVRDEGRLALVPATDLDAQRLAALPRFWPFTVLVRLSRTNKLNRWYRGVIGKAADGLEWHPNRLHNELKLRASLVEQVMLSAEQRGVVFVKLRSTAFPVMGDEEFSAYCDFAIPCLFRDFLPGMHKPEQRKLVTEWAGRRPALEQPPRIILPA